MVGELRPLTAAERRQEEREGNGSGGGQHVERWRKKIGEKSREIQERDGEKERESGERWGEEVQTFCIDLIK